MKLKGELSASNTVIGFPVTNARSGNNFLTIGRQEDGSVVIPVPAVPEWAPADLNLIGLPATGIVTVAVEGKVLEHNADDESTAGKVHRWNRDSWEDRVYLKLDPNVN